ncbi:putative fungistatic metabolite [Haliotis rubra]|uniref:putative fungistatic metabolite n=1 Tax=Haliotis rubra TaxID=36100 RepID=UPI001EE5BC6E|nr:putative fungistatic metabolite [Haliotis rubra]
MDVIVTAVTVYNVLTLGYCQGQLLSQATLTKNTPTSRTFVCTCSDAASCTADKWKDLLAECRQMMEKIKHETTSAKAQETTTLAAVTTTSTQRLTTTGPAYRGCYQDKTPRLLLNEHIKDTTAMTIDMCRNHCTLKGYSFYGLEAGWDCFCGNEIKSGSEKVSDNECNEPCAGDNTKTCGGWWRVAIYLVV